MGRFKIFMDRFKLTKHISPKFIQIQKNLSKYSHQAKNAFPDSRRQNN